jgi:hypothetical protein
MIFSYLMFHTKSAKLFRKDLKVVIFMSLHPAKAGLRFSLRTLREIIISLLIS